MGVLWINKTLGRVLGLYIFKSFFLWGSGAKPDGRKKSMQSPPSSLSKDATHLPDWRKSLLTLPYPLNSSISCHSTGSICDQVKSRTSGEVGKIFQNSSLTNSFFRIVQPSKPDTMAIKTLVKCPYVLSPQYHYSTSCCASSEIKAFGAPIWNKFTSNDSCRNGMFDKWASTNLSFQNPSNGYRSSISLLCIHETCFQ